ncbi:MAG: HAD family phosphatase [Sphingobacterium sp.]|jgi:2-haloacid dehalogenase|nr:HAD family phosphatase [Sphingobacterium sp.]
MINTIVFDFGGVLIDWNPRYLYKEIFKDKEEMEWFLSNVCTTEWNLEQDRGRLFSEGISLLKKSFPEHTKNIDFFHTNWEDMLKGEITGTVQILRELKEKYKVYGLTNWSAETFPIAFSRFAFLRLFDGIIVSGEEKIIKPDKEIFQLLLERYDLRAESCVFIDDSKKNIDASIHLGFYGIHFLDSDQLKLELRKIGVF